MRDCLKFAPIKVAVQVIVFCIFGLWGWMAFAAGQALTEYKHGHHHFDSLI